MNLGTPSQLSFSPHTGRDSLFKKSNHCLVMCGFPSRRSQSPDSDRLLRQHQAEAGTRASGRRLHLPFRVLPACRSPMLSSCSVPTLNPGSATPEKHEWALNRWDLLPTPRHHASQLPAFEGTSSPGKAFKAGFPALQRGSAEFRTPGRGTYCRALSPLLVTSAQPHIQRKCCQITGERAAGMFKSVRQVAMVQRATAWGALACLPISEPAQGC